MRANYIILFIIYKNLFTSSFPAVIVSINKYRIKNNNLQFNNFPETAFCRHDVISSELYTFKIFYAFNDRFFIH